MTTTEALQEVRALIEKGWTRLSNAKDAEGMTVSPTGERCCSWCLNGAMIRVACKNDTSYEDMRKPIFGKVGNFVTWNDNPKRTKQEVLDLLDQIIMELV